MLSAISKNLKLINASFRLETNSEPTVVKLPDPEDRLQQRVIYDSVSQLVPPSRIP